MYLCARMKRFAAILIAALAAAACAGRGGAGLLKTPAAPQPKHYTYRVKAVYAHDTSSYTQGLQFVGGELWEGTGLHGLSTLRRTDLETGRTVVVAELPRSEFGEGITVLGDRVYQLTWTSNVAHVYDRTTGRKLADRRYTGEGWGLTTDGRKLYMSNGTDRIYRLDPDSFEREASVSVSFEGRPVPYLNELEWIDGRLWANVYTSDEIVIIDPATGFVEGVVDLAGLLPDEERTPETDVLNGIAYDAERGRILVTGKNWSKLFEIEIIER